MKTKRVVIILSIFLSLILISQIAAYSLFPRPVENNTFFPDTPFIFEFNFTDSSGIVLLSNLSTLTTDSSGVAFIDIDIFSAFSQVPTRFIHWRNDTGLQVNKTFDDKIFNKIFVNDSLFNRANITELIVNGINISDINSSFILKNGSTTNLTLTNLLGTSGNDITLKNGIQFGTNNFNGSGTFTTTGNIFVLNIFSSNAGVMPIVFGSTSTGDTLTLANNLVDTDSLTLGIIADFGGYNITTTGNISAANFIGSGELLHSVNVSGLGLASYQFTTNNFNGSGNFTTTGIGDFGKVEIGRNGSSNTLLAIGTDNTDHNRPALFEITTSLINPRLFNGGLISVIDFPDLGLSNSQQLTGFFQSNPVGTAQDSKFYFGLFGGVSGKLNSTQGAGSKVNTFIGLQFQASNQGSLIDTNALGTSKFDTRGLNLITSLGWDNLNITGFAQGINYGIKVDTAMDGNYNGNTDGENYGIHILTSNLLDGGTGNINSYGLYLDITPSVVDIGNGGNLTSYGIYQEGSGINNFFEGNINVTGNFIGSGALLNSVNITGLDGSSLINISHFNQTYQDKADYQFTNNNFNGSGNFTTTGGLKVVDFLGIGVNPEAVASLGGGGIVINSSSTSPLIIRNYELGIIDIIMVTSTTTSGIFFPTISKSGDNAILQRTGGQVGIGKDFPIAKLDVVGDSVASADAPPVLNITGGDSTGSPPPFIDGNNGASMYFTAGAGGAGGAGATDGLSGDIVFTTKADAGGGVFGNVIFLEDGGKFLIGRSTPMSGINVSIVEIQGNLTINGSLFVLSPKFSLDYNRSQNSFLDKLPANESIIGENKHLNKNYLFDDEYFVDIWTVYPYKKEVCNEQEFYNETSGKNQTIENCLNITDKSRPVIMNNTKTDITQITAKNRILIDEIKEYIVNLLNRITGAEDKITELESFRTDICKEENTKYSKYDWCDVAP